MEGLTQPQFANLIEACGGKQIVTAGASEFSFDMAFSRKVKTFHFSTIFSKKPITEKRWRLLKFDANWVDCGVGRLFELRLTVSGPRRSVLSFYRAIGKKAPKLPRGKK